MEKGENNMMNKIEKQLVNELIGNLEDCTEQLRLFLELHEDDEDAPKILEKANKLLTTIRGGNIMEKKYLLLDTEYDKKVIMNLSEILNEINRNRSETWTDYNITDWEEGLEMFTQYTLIKEV